VDRKPAVLAERRGNVLRHHDQPTGGTQLRQRCRQHRCGDAPGREAQDDGRRWRAVVITGAGGQILLPREADLKANFAPREKSPTTPTTASGGFAGYVHHFHRPSRRSLRFNGTAAWVVAPSWPLASDLVVAEERAEVRSAGSQGRPDRGCGRRCSASRIQLPRKSGNADAAHRPSRSAQAEAAKLGTESTPGRPGRQPCWRPALAPGRAGSPSTRRCRYTGQQADRLTAAERRPGHSRNEGTPAGGPHTARRSFGTVAENRGRQKKGPLAFAEKRPRPVLEGRASQ